MGAKKENEKRINDGLGPGAYLIKATNTAPLFSMGSRFDSDVRSKDHIKPRKVDGPGPGSYPLPGSIRAELSTNEKKKTTFGVAKRDWSDLPRNVPAPNTYYPAKFTEATH
jgi:Sperm-tail PG-rich repeat